MTGRAAFFSEFSWSAHSARPLFFGGVPRPPASQDSPPMARAERRGGAPLAFARAGRQACYDFVTITSYGAWAGRVAYSPATTKTPDALRICIYPALLQRPWSAGPGVFFCYLTAFGPLSAWRADDIRNLKRNMQPARRLVKRRVMACKIAAPRQQVPFRPEHIAHTEAGRRQNKQGQSRRADWSGLRLAWTEAVLIPAPFAGWVLRDFRRLGFANRSTF